LTLKARLFDAKGKDKEFDLGDSSFKLQDQQLLWIDTDRDEADLAIADKALGWPGRLEELREVGERPRVVEGEGFVRLRVHGVQEGTKAPKPVTLDLVAARNVVVSVHDKAIDGLELPLQITEGETRLGALDAATFVAILLDGMLTGFFHAVEGIERRIDKLDQQALSAREAERILGELVGLRGEIATLRRAINPQREVFAALERPEMALQTEVGTPWPAVVERFREAVEAVENARELLVGCFDIVMTRTAQRTNDIMRILTVVSSVLLPSVVIAGVMGMNFKAEIFDDPFNFYLVIAAMILLAIGILGFARWRRWI
jgi:Mg2+ and Co2+ transporter CorA